MSDEQEECINQNFDTKLTDAYATVALCNVTLVFLLVPISLFAWYRKKERLVYLRKRSFPAVVLLGISSLLLVVSGSLSKFLVQFYEFPRDCVYSNFNFLITIPLFALSSFTSVLTFWFKALFAHNLVRSVENNDSITFYDRLLNVLSKRETNLILMIVKVIMLLAIAGLFVLNQCLQLGANECIIADITNKKFTVLLATLTGIFFVEAIWISFRLKTFPDPFRILKEIRICATVTIILLLPGFIIVSFSSLPTNTKHNLALFLIEWPAYFYFIYLVPFQIYNALRFNLKDAVVSATSLERILRDPVGHDLLKKYLITEFSVENILFLDEIYELKQIDSQNNVDINNKIDSIYDRFIEDRVINVAGSVYQELISLHNTQSLIQSSFDDAESEIFQMVELDSFRRFKLCSDFRFYIGVASLDNQVSL